MNLLIDINIVLDVCAGHRGMVTDVANTEQLLRLRSQTVTSSCNASAPPKAATGRLLNDIRL